MMKYYANYKIYHEVKDGDICRKSIKGFDLSLSKPESTFMALNTVLHGIFNKIEYTI